jgi:peptidoglycan hydrolase-like protein with peptidoglycan-binding domain
VDALRAAARGSTANVSSSNGGTSATRGRSRGGAKSLGDRVPVKQGMRGHDIRVLQDLLGDAGYDVVVDGEFGDRTFKAVQEFEGTHQRPVDGVMDADDITTLRAAAAAGPQTTPASAEPAQTTAGPQATVGPDGLAVAPAGAPPQVQAIIAAGNEIASKPYKYGGGHGKWDDSGYDCSGSVSYALHGAGLLDEALPSGSFTSWGDPGPGQWVTIYANGGHMYMVVAGLRFDTSGRSNHNSRWQTEQRSSAGYVVRHPPGL